MYLTEHDDPHNQRVATANVQYVARTVLGWRLSDERARRVWQVGFAGECYVFGLADVAEAIIEIS